MSEKTQQDDVKLSAPQDCPCCGNAYLAIRTDTYKDKREFVYCDSCGCLADRRVWNRIDTAPAGRAQAVQAGWIPPQIAAIIERLHTQDNRITQDPLFAVQQLRRVYGVGEGYRDGVVWVDDEGGESDGAGPFKHGSRKVGYRDVWEFVTGGLTERGCAAFIVCNGHNLNKPRIYAYSGYRNAEFIALRKWLMSLAPLPAAPSQQETTP